MVVLVDGYAWLQKSDLSVDQIVNLERLLTVHQSECDFRGKTFVLGMVHSLAGNLSYPDDLWRWPGCVIVDEVHRISARTWCSVPSKFSAGCHLGIFATLRRKDGADIEACY